MDEAKWYVIATMSGYENKVATNLEKIVENRHLQDWIHEIRIPTETVVEVKDNQRKEVERKLFPSYVLVKMVMTDESWFVVRNVRGCTGFVGPNGKAIPLTEKEIAALGVEKKEIVVDTRWATPSTSSTVLWRTSPAWSRRSTARRIWSV